MDYETDVRLHKDLSIEQVKAILNHHSMHEAELEEVLSTYPVINGRVKADDVMNWLGY